MQNKLYTNSKATDCALQLEVTKSHIFLKKYWYRYEIKIVYSEKYDG